MPAPIARRGPDGVTRAAVLGIAGGTRTFLPLAVLAVRRRVGGNGPGRFAILAASVGELGFDKDPAVPGRGEAQGVIGRLIASGIAGRELGGTPGIAAGVAGAALGTYATQKLRADLTEALPLSPTAVAALEDVGSFAIGAVATAGLDDEAPEPQPFDPAHPAPSTEEPDAPPLLGGIARGLAAGAVGTGVMTVAQLAYYQLSGEAQSEAPANIGQKLLGRAGVRVKRRQKPLLNQVMHVVYGTSWGAAYGIAASGASTARPPLLPSGLAFGAGVWGSSLVELPAFDQSPPFWRMPPFHLALDAGFHLIYGLATAAAYRALER